MDIVFNAMTDIYPEFDSDRMADQSMCIRDSLQMFQLQTEDGWDELAEVLANDPRVTIR